MKPEGGFGGMKRAGGGGFGANKPRVTPGIRALCPVSMTQPYGVDNEYIALLFKCSMQSILRPITGRHLHKFSLLADSRVATCTRLSSR
eukprot:COSAG02_NODE_12169_length_1585_cov_2.435397_1_plen_89_part_00